MTRISGIDLNNEKRIDIGLTAIYGIGRQNVVKILSEAKIEPQVRVKDITGEELARLQKVVEMLQVEGNLRKRIQQDIERLKIIKCYRGIRHIQNLPVRGQRTRTNARTKRGKRKTIGAIKKKETAKFGGTEKSES